MKDEDDDTALGANEEDDSEEDAANDQKVSSISPSKVSGPTCADHPACHRLVGLVAGQFILLSEKYCGILPYVQGVEAD